MPQASIQAISFPPQVSELDKLFSPDKTRYPQFLFNETSGFSGTLGTTLIGIIQVQDQPVISIKVTGHSIFFLQQIFFRFQSHWLGPFSWIGVEEELFFWYGHSKTGLAYTQEKQSVMCDILLFFRSLHLEHFLAAF